MRYDSTTISTYSEKQIEARYGYTIDNALKQLSILGLGDAEIITDNGYYSEHNLAALFLASFDFVTLVKVGLKWVKAEIDARVDDFGSVFSVCPFDMGTRGISVMLMREFVKVRKYANKKMVYGNHNTR